MTLRSITSLAVALAASVISHAQEINANEEQRLEALARSNADFYVPRSTISVGFRVLTSGANVKFGQLGQIPYNLTPAAISEGSVTRTYNNGTVSADAPRGNEIEATAGTVIVDAGTRYNVYSTTPITDSKGTAITTPVLIGSYVSYAPGQTRNWLYDFNDQVSTPGYVAFSTYSATSTGGSFSNKQGPSGGLEIILDHGWGKPHGRFQFGWQSGISLNDINSKVSGSVTANIVAKTDYYSLLGATAPSIADLTTKTGDLKDPTTGIVTTGGLELTVPIASVPDAALSGHEHTTPGAATVKGMWQVKGAYFMARVGPSIRAQLSENFAMSVTAGIAGAYAGTRYSADETMAVPEAIDGSVISTPADNYTFESKFLGGYYADVNLEWAANETTGFYGGVSTQKFQDYDQSVGGRTAHIDIGSSVGLRGGITIKF